jgi:hypothetical protein
MLPCSCNGKHSERPHATILSLGLGELKLAAERQNFVAGLACVSVQSAAALAAGSRLVWAFVLFAVVRKADFSMQNS